MKKFKIIIALMLVLFSLLALTSCDGGEESADGGKKSEKGENKVATVELSDAIKASMEANNALTVANYFLADDGSILMRDSDRDVKEAGRYAQLPNVKKIIKGAGLSSFALTDDGKLYFEDKVISENVDMATYCNTNTNVEGFCVINNELKRIDSYRQIQENALNYMFKNYPSEDKLSGNIAFIEVDKHDFIVLNNEGKFFAYWMSEAYGTLDFTGFEDLAVIDIAKRMDTMISGEVKSLTVAGIKGDGTVVATGTYKDDILSWGKLADIAMSDGMIVGLTEDGKVKMTGDFAEKMRETVEGWQDIIAIEAGYATGGNVDNIVTALDKNGNFYYCSIMNERSGIKAGSASVDKVNDDASWHKYTPDGKEYYSDWEGNWVENTDE